MRTEAEMQLTLSRLHNEFGCDVSEAEELHGQELAEWLEIAEEKLLERLQGQKGGPSSDPQRAA